MKIINSKEKDVNYVLEEITEMLDCVRYLQKESVQNPQ